MRQMRNSYTFGLFAMPNFFRGAARVLDLGGTLNVYNESANEAEADAKALSSDWRQVGCDMQNAMDKCEYGKD